MFQKESPTQTHKEDCARREWEGHRLVPLEQIVLNMPVGVGWGEGLMPKCWGPRSLGSSACSHSPVPYPLANCPCSHRAAETAFSIITSHLQTLTLAHSLLEPDASSPPFALASVHPTLLVLPLHLPTKGWVSFPESTLNVSPPGSFLGSHFSA